MKMETVRPTKKPNPVVVNVGGVKHKTTWATLGRIQGTRLSALADLREQDDSFNPEKDEYFFDRNPLAFQCVLEYYRTNELHINESICGNAMKRELVFWQLYETEIEACCWGAYSKHLDHKETLANLDNTFSTTGLNDSEVKKLSSLKQFQAQVWNHLEYPSTSRGAKVLMLISLAVVLVSILAFVCESHYHFQVLSNDTSVKAPDPELYYGSSSKNCYGVASEFMGQPYPDTETIQVITYVDYACLTFFVLELIIRFTFAPNKCEFMKGILNVIDVVCIVPQIVSIALELGNYGEHANTAGDILKVISILRMIRVLRIFKLMKHYSAFKVLAYTIKVSTKELLLMVVFLLSGVMIFASLVHFFEKDNFYSIPYAIWWALVTMTTVGYGDVVPKTPMGYMVGCLCVIGGVLVIAFTVPVVVNNFTLYYSHANSRAKLPFSKKRDSVKERSVVAIGPLSKDGAELRPTKRPSTQMSSITMDDNMSRSYNPNLNILSDEPSKPVKSSKLTFSPVLIRESAAAVPVATLRTAVTPTQPPAQHEVEARMLVDSLNDRERELKIEKKKQYMLAYERLAKKKANNRK